MEKNDVESKKKPIWKLIIDNEHYVWEESSITGSQIRTLGAVPDGVHVWQKIKHAPDKLIEPADVVSLTPDGPEKFSLQEASSGAGA